MRVLVVVVVVCWAGTTTGCTLMPPGVVDSTVVPPSWYVMVAAAADGGAGIVRGTVTTVGLAEVTTTEVGEGLDATTIVLEEDDDDAADGAWTTTGGGRLCCCMAASLSLLGTRWVSGFLVGELAEGGPCTGIPASLDFMQCMLMWRFRLNFVVKALPQH